MKMIRIISLYLIFLQALLITNVQAHQTTDKELISPAELALSGDGLTIIDIRQVDEYAAGHVPGAHLIPLADVSASRLNSLGLTPKDSIVLYGVSETSARKAKMLLEILGYKQVRILMGGFTHWLEDGHEAVAGAPADTTPAGRNTDAASALQVVPASYDFGVINKIGGVVQTTFAIENNSDDEISITEITTSCGCTTAEVNEKKIPAGDSRQLTVYFDPNFHKEPEGKFSRTVFLQTSEEKEILAKIEVEIED